MSLNLAGGIIRRGVAGYARRLATCFIAMLLLCLSALPSAAQNESFEDTERVPASIHHVASGGYWAVGGEEGYFRAVVVAGGIEHVVHRLYIQWLRNDMKTQGYKLIRTVNVKELNMGHGYILKVKTAFGNENAFKIDISAHSRGGQAKRFAITAKGDGRYVIRSR